jgi:hypothetical protein
MLNGAQQYLDSAPWLAIVPGVAITIAVAGSTSSVTGCATHLRAATKETDMGKFSPFKETLWYFTAPQAPETPMLEGEVTADVCIVGAGYSGLTTAIELARQGISVAVVERAEIAFGGLGRSAGHRTPTFTHYGLPELRGCWARHSQIV